MNEESIFPCQVLNTGTQSQVFSFCFSFSHRKYFLKYFFLSHKITYYRFTDFLLKFDILIKLKTIEKS